LNSVLRLVALCLASVSAITLASQRITTHPAEPYLKQLFPTAAAISPHEGTPLHWKIYGESPARNPKAAPIALAWWSTDVVPLERGYNGPTHMLVGMDMTGIIVGTVMAYSTDPYAFFSVEPPEFAAQFKGKSIRAPFRVGEDIHAVSRATLTVSSATRAVRDSARTMAKLFLNPANLRPAQSGPQPLGGTVTR
jgi:transcriptional regulator of nitric oxide reductase